MIDIEPTKLMTWLDEHRYRRSTPVIAGLLVIVIWLFVVPEAKSGQHCVLGAAVLFVVVVLCAWLRRIPRKRNKEAVGFLVAIAVYDRKEEKELQQHFIDTLRDLLARSSATYPFELVVLPNYYAQQIVAGADPQVCFDKARCQFMVRGRARLAASGGKEKHVLDLHGLVRHKPLPTEALQVLQRDFSELLPRRIAFSSGIALEGFELSADCVAVVSKYIIAMAAAQSGDAQYSRALLEELNSLRTQLSQQRPPEQAVLRKVPVRLAEVYSFIAARELRLWREDHSPERIRTIESFLDKIDDLKLAAYLPKLLRSICLFLRDDVRGAMAELRKCRNETESTWRVNLAFLYAYQGDLKSAKRELQVAARGQLDHSTPNQAEQFIVWVLDERSDKTQLWYLLGLINHLLKEDNDQALSDLERFLCLADKSRFSGAIQHARALVQKLRAGTA